LLETISLTSKVSQIIVKVHWGTLRLQAAA